MRVFLIAACLILAGITAGCVNGPAKRAGFDEIRGKEWELTEVIAGSGAVTIDRQKLEAEGMADVYTLLIGDERISGRAFPNRYLAPYKLEEGRKITFGAVAGTLMASIGDSGGLREEAYFRFLDNVYQWDAAKGRLELLTRDPGGADAKLIYREKL
jgi:heat shock protein HslJ